MSSFIALCTFGIFKGNETKKNTFPSELQIASRAPSVLMSSSRRSGLCRHLLHQPHVMGDSITLPDNSTAALRWNCTRSSWKCTWTRHDVCPSSQLLGNIWTSVAGSWDDVDGGRREKVTPVQLREKPTLVLIGHTAVWLEPTQEDTQKFSQLCLVCNKVSAPCGGELRRGKCTKKKKWKLISRERPERTLTIGCLVLTGEKLGRGSWLCCDKSSWFTGSSQPIEELIGIISAGRYVGADWK